MIQSPPVKELSEDRKRTVFGTIVLSLALFCSITLAYDNFWNSVLCAFYFPFEDKDTGRTKFLFCSNVEQVLDGDNSRNLADNAESGADWRVFSPASPESRQCCGSQSKKTGTWCFSTPAWKARTALSLFTQKMVPACGACLRSRGRRGCGRKWDDNMFLICVVRRTDGSARM